VKKSLKKGIMVVSRKILFILLIVTLISGCNPITHSIPTEIATTPTSAINTMTPETLSTMQPQAALFIDSDQTNPTPTSKFTKQSRLVTINLPLLLDENSNPRELSKNTEINVNLFPDTNYIGVIESTGQDESGFYWLGYLKDVEYSTLTIIYTGQVFIFKFANPAGVYEVSVLSNGYYQIIQVDQNSMPGGEG
jgi:hypothetical protein